VSELENTRGDELIGLLEQSSGLPLRAMIEISDRCNEVCVHCYQEQGHKGEMSTAQIKAVMDELAQMGVLILTISGGEATLRPDLIELLEHARKCSFAIRLFTNGLTMTRELAAELRRVAVQVVEISLYSHRAEVHDFVTGVPRSFVRTTQGIRYLAELGVEVHVKSPMMSMNEDDIDALRSFALSLGANSFSADPSALMPRELGDRAPERLARSQAAFEAAMSTLTEDRAQRPTGPMPRPAMNGPLCGAGKTVHVEPNGELRPCTMLDLKLGDVREGIADARANNDAMNTLRALTWSDAHGCRGCDLSGVCVRCFASALAEVGDALAPYPTACATARSQYAVRTGAQPEIVADKRGRSEIGPYRHVGDNRFTAIAYEVSAADHALAERLGWTRRHALNAPGDAVRPGELVQLRRPGSKKPRLVQIPSASDVSSSSPGVVVDSATTPNSP
jgi:radical SAM protein with 4Fe4S-binding SPASM domain